GAAWESTDECTIRCCARLGCTGRVFAPLIGPPQAPRPGSLFPGLPCARGAAEGIVMKVTLQPSGAVLDVEPGERILDAARRLGYECPQSCRNGNCHICAALLVEGRVRQAGAELDHGELLTCLAEPLESCVLHWDGVLAPGELPVRTFACQVLELADVGGDVCRMRLRAPAGRLPRYHAGQYLLLQRDDGEWAAFSLASAPHMGRDLELHVLTREDSARQLVEQLRRTRLARVQMPFGDTHLAELPDGPL